MQSNLCYFLIDRLPSIDFFCMNCRRRCFCLFSFNITEECLSFSYLIFFPHFRLYFIFDNPNDFKVILKEIIFFFFIFSFLLWLYITLQMFRSLVPPEQFHFMMLIMDFIVCSAYFILMLSSSMHLFCLCAYVWFHIYFWFSRTGKCLNDNWTNADQSPSAELFRFPLLY